MQGTDLCTLGPWPSIWRTVSLFIITTLLLCCHPRNICSWHVQFIRLLMQRYIILLSHTVILGNTIALHTSQVMTFFSRAYHYYIVLQIPKSWTFIGQNTGRSLWGFLWIIIHSASYLQRSGCSYLAHFLSNTSFGKKLTPLPGLLPSICVQMFPVLMSEISKETTVILHLVLHHPHFMVDSPNPVCCL